jgi:serine/threonine protein kinase
LQIRTQLEIFRQIGDQLDESHHIVQTGVLDTLVVKLSFADAKLKGISKSQSLQLGSNSLLGILLPKRERVNFALHKSSLDEAINDLESWQRLSFNTLWLVATKPQSQHVDKALDRAKESSQGQGNKMIRAAIAVRNPLRDIGSARVFLPPKKLASAKTTEIAFSSVKSVQVDDKWRLMDSVSDLSKESVRELAVKLKSADPLTFGLLTCLGAVHDETNNEFSIIFRKPDTMSRPETLRAKIMANKSIHSLSDRFRVATQLARAVSSVHTFDMVHKSIRPENIILFQDLESALGSAFLFGFGSVRRDDEGTRLSGDTDWPKNIYRHPQRQGSRIQDRYIMQHDIYSLGVCLLEIGLWSSFVEYTPNQSPTRSQTYDLCAESSNEFGHPELVKSRLLSLATKELRRNMGTKYARIVESCLTCLDLDNEDFGEESELQEDGVNVAVRYIEKV